MSTNCITHIVIKGDTLQRLAAKYGINSWETIAYLNDLKYPFIVDEIVSSTLKSSNIKYLGDSLLIPVTDLTVVDFISDEELQKRTYGCDLFLNFDTSENGTLTLENIGQMESDVNNDIKQVLGVENIKQALLLRLTTTYGELPMHPDYGSNFMTYIGHGKTQSNLVKMKLEVIETFKKDLRVSDVRNCVVTAISGGVSIDCDIILVTPSQSFSFNEVIAA